MTLVVTLAAMILAYLSINKDEIKSFVKEKIRKGK